MAGKNERYAEKDPSTAPTNLNPSSDHPAPALPQTIEGADEADRIASLIDQSAATFENFPPPPRGRYGNRGNYRTNRSNGYQASRGGSASASYGGASSGNMYPDRAPRPSQNYVCHRCNKPGHWIDQCPTNGDPTFDKIKVRAPTGIPRSMLRQVDAPESGTGLQDSSGHFVTLQPNEEEFARQTVGLRLSQAAAAAMSKDKDPKAPDPQPSTDSVAHADENGKTTSHESVDAPEEEKELLKPGAQTPAVSDSAHTASAATSQSVLSKSSNDKNTTPNVPEVSISKPHIGNGARGNSARNNGRHVHKPGLLPQSGPGPLKPPAGIPMPPIPGVPPMGMPPFPPGMPPPPPHILMAMAAASGQNGIPPLPPGILPNVPIPFGNSLNPSDPDAQAPELPGNQQPSFPHFMAMMQAQQVNPMGGPEGGIPGVEKMEKNGSSTSKPPDESVDEPQPVSLEAEGIPRVSTETKSSREGSLGKENGKSDWERPPEEDRSLDQSNSERVDSQSGSRSASPSHGNSDIREERFAHRKPNLDENGRRSFLDERGVQQSRTSRRSQSRFHSPRRRSSSPGLASPDRGRHFSPPRRRERSRVEGPPFRTDLQMQIEMPTGIDTRLGRPARGHSTRSPESSPVGRRPLPRIRSPIRDATFTGVRRRSRSPSMRSRRTRSPRRSPNAFLPRSRSPGNRRRRHGSPLTSIRGRSPHRRQDQWQSPPTSPSRFERSGRFRSRSPLEPYRYKNIPRDRALSPQERSRTRRSSASPSRLNGRMNGANGYDLPVVGNGLYLDPRFDEKRSSVVKSSRSNAMGGSRMAGPGRDGVRLVAMTKERADRKHNEFEVPHDPVEAGYDFSRRPGFDSELNDRGGREERLRTERRVRRERDLDSRIDDDARHSKRLRRERSLERLEPSRRDRRDRRSVHDRLGQPQRERKRGQRRSVHDRLG